MATGGDGRIYVRDPEPAILNECQFAEVRLQAPLMAQDRLIVSEATAMRWFADAAGAGFVGINEGPKRVDLKIIWVFPEDRGQGFGRSMMLAVIELAGGRAIRLVAEERLLPFYERFGFLKRSRYKETSWHLERPAP